jgi:dephospho-CoA kinase
MKLVGLGGGIGSGKSTVSTYLASKGAVVVDADVVARQVVEPGTAALAAIRERFGPDVLAADGSLIRAALAKIVFADPDALQALNAITHPAIGVEINRQVAEHVNTERVVILDAALLFDTQRVGMVGRIVVDVDPELAIVRLQQFRGFTEPDARARVASQMARHERVARADFVIDNSGTPEDLVRSVEMAWHWIQTLPSS